MEPHRRLGEESIAAQVFMTKKRTRDNKSMMSEFKGGDLNKYTAKTYAIQNGNEVFGEFAALGLLWKHECEPVLANLQPVAGDINGKWWIDAPTGVKM
ncbi:hypothetical protein NECAME_13089 [Necator americanus]|uniref:Uncharacterized protein n=1 Tax=Necator americanus TaxID=51031 RepID=W2SXM3_NECAM|nr:hypothetical protein NECAME_13089 [Necator americanus]ETN74278.1 hypothetical protein NECAME_13089 [Necator americanus]